jgi:hypothetical protein
MWHAWERKVRGFGGKARRKETARTTKAEWEDGIRIDLRGRLAWGVWIGFDWLRIGTVAELL